MKSKTVGRGVGKVSVYKVYDGKYIEVYYQGRFTPPRLTPIEARALGRALIQMADEIRPERKKSS